MDEVPAKLKRLHAAIHIILYAFLVVISFLVLAYTGYRLILAQHLFIQWRVLPVPPAPVAELLPAWAGVCILGTNGEVYLHDAYGPNLTEPWQQTEYMPDPVLAEQLSSRCTQEELQFSFSLKRPTSLVDCRLFSVHAEAATSYAVLDGEKQVWVWVNRANWSGGLVWFVGTLACAFMLAPSVAMLLLRAMYRRLYRGRNLDDFSP